VSDRADAAPDAGLPFATLDLDRERRQGAPEVVFGEGKSPGQCVAIAERIAAAGHGVLLTRTSDAARMALRARFPEARVHDVARTVWLARAAPRTVGSGHACVVTAGTSDLPVADECLETLAFLGVPAERVADVGVAGVHRVLARADQLRSARAVVVVAGMDGALPSVVGGLVAGPVIAVPTSVGYGAAFGGVAALLTMLNSCAAGVTVVNIDNGFGAAMAVWRLFSVTGREELVPK
jgi:NCAIR mutase (PurE)-related protein